MIWVNAMFQELEEPGEVYVNREIGLRKIGKRKLTNAR